MRISTTLLSGGVMGVALLGLVATGCERDQERYGADEAQPANDMAVASVVERRIQNEMAGPPSSNIDVRVADGVATLTGSVPDASAKEKAEDVAEDVEGVERVENMIVVASATGGGAPAPDSHLGD